jgi:mono/diheme cytochrome c family protein
MRYFLLIFGIVVIGTILIAGRRGDISRNRPIQIFPDMKRQAKLRPQTANGFFASGFSSQLPQPGTIAQSKPMSVGDKEVYSFEDSPVNTGREPGKTNFVAFNPYPMNETLLKRGQQRFNIYCAPCHGQTGQGDGVVKKFGMATVRSLHEQIVVNQGDGEIFNTISNGKLTMQGYGPQIPVEDRWAIVAYVRALHLSRLGSVEDLSTETRAKLK